MEVGLPAMPFIDTSDTHVHTSLPHFSPLSQDYVLKLISKTFKKSCLLDPIPTKVMIQLLGVLLPVITKIVNKSLQSGSFPDSWKETNVLPLLKSSHLDVKYQNFRPFSNLPYIFKLTERAVADQITEHMPKNNLHSPLQSAYKKMP